MKSKEWRKEGREERTKERKTEKKRERKEPYKKVREGEHHTVGDGGKGESSWWAS